MSVRHLFVIGAMKSGTTTLHDDLAQHPEISLAEKEAAGLRHFDTTTDTGRRRYRDSLGSGRLTVDVTADYAMTPHLPSVASRAAAYDGDAAVVYLVREPVARIVSHHHHDLALGIVPPSVDDAVRRDPRLLDYTRYATQLAPWRNAFPDDAIRVVKFEDYVASRRETVDGLLAWLGLAALPEATDLDSVSNATSGRVAARGLKRRILHSSIYRRRLRPLIPSSLRERAAQGLLDATPERPDPPSAATLEFISDELAPDLADLADSAGVGWMDHNAPCPEGGEHEGEVTEP